MNGDVVRAPSEELSDFDSFHSTVHENDLFQVDDDVDLASQVLKNMLTVPTESHETFEF